MTDAMSDFYKRQREWDRAILYLDCYFGLKQDYTKEVAKDKIHNEFNCTPEQLRSRMFD